MPGFAKNFSLPQVFFKVLNHDADTHFREFHATEKANSTERGGRKVSGLQPEGQGSGIAEVERKGSPTTVYLTARPMMVGGVDSNR
jgi:hypothetical protein